MQLTDRTYTISELAREFSVTPRRCVFTRIKACSRRAVTA